MDYRLDEVDKRILYRLAEDARDTSAPMIADEVNVSAGTIRNRISQLEENDVIQGYHANIDYERVENRLTNLYICNADVSDHQQLVAQILSIPGVVNLREVMTGRGNLQVMAVGESMDDLSRIARELRELGVEIEDEGLVQREAFHPYQPFGPSDRQDQPSITDFIDLSGNAEVVELTVSADAPIAGMTLERATEDGLLPEEVLLVAIERDDAMITPKGNTTVSADDLVTVFSRDGIDEATLAVFTDER